MNQIEHPLDHAARLLGGRAEMARRLAVTPAAVGNWKTRGVPIEHCPVIERLTNRQVSRQLLRPADWHSIWPELANTKPRHKAVKALAAPATAANHGA